MKIFVVRCTFYFFVFATAVFVTGCSYPTRNQEAKIIDDNYGYRWKNLDPSKLEDTLIIVTASGGGTRATALTLSVLRALNEIKLFNGKTLAQEIDLISSVSGGSVAAGYFALKGTDGFDTLENNFIRKNGMVPLFFQALNPLGLMQLSMPGKERIDLLINYLDKQLFHNATYQTLLTHKHRPYLILNAADMVEGIPFPFTQYKMDYLCSDLSSFSLATAVAASAAFPVALSPVTLKNYSPCAATQDKKWPPGRVTSNIDKLDGINLWYKNPQRTMLGRAENAYILGRENGQWPKAYIHLLDGGIADNLGIFEPLRMLETYDTDTNPAFLGMINSGQITKLVFVVINARSFSPSNLDQQQSTPNILDMLLASINAPIDRTTASSARQLHDLLFETFNKIGIDDPVLTARFKTLFDNTALISIDFDAIPDNDCRRKFHSIPTSWSLNKKQIDAVLKIGGALLGNDPQFDTLLKLLNSTKPTSLPTINEVCKDI